ncbi:probable LRR receptor-like serine/threonine-protein kinase At2g16250 isoform X2 [Punica granatum]|nr:probable LRR receptor-like serine/threonine-protein kinase At2g16250 isoform X2 [Punica granatum]
MMSATAMEGSRRGSFLAWGSSAILFLVLFLMQCAAAQQQLSSTDRAALLDLRSSLGLQARDWPIKGDPCTNWTGITCRDGRVTGINISGFKRTRLGRRSPQFAVDALGNFTHLSSFNASGFLLPGSIPDWLGSRVSSLHSLDLRSCSISGAVPGSLGSLSGLKFLYLSDNSLTGRIDSNLGELRELSVLNLSGNLLTGLIPDEFSKLGNLTSLDLSSNLISGAIPPSLGSISGLQVLNLSDNSLTSSVPVQLSNLSRLTVLDLSTNSISGSLPAKLSVLTSLQELRIGNNDLAGQFPENLLSAFAQLKFLDVSGNNFTGEFPRISSRWGVNATDNAVFNFSNNMFYGTLNLSSLEFLGSVDLSGNYFQGNVSNNGMSNNVRLEKNCLQIVRKQRSLSDCREFYSQRGLFFDDFGVPQPTVPPLPNEPASKKSRRPWVYILIGIGSGLGFIMLLLVLIVFLLRRLRRARSGQRGRSLDVGPVPEGDGSTVPKEPFTLSGFGDSFSYDQMVHATCNFNKSNLIKNGHSGDLYLGLLDGRAPVVIKRITGAGAGPHADKRESYAAELEFFRSASHSRLVPLLGHCLEQEGEKFLVYKYMPNGDLASSFYRATASEDESFQSLDWITRLKIAIGAAEGLSYLHHECSPPLVHRDVQASSILLDDKFEVRLGSLSEVHAQEGDQHHNAITRLLRKPQTSEQGPSGPSTATCTYDVFCFGKVLLELVTGKIGIGQSDDAALREWLEQTLPFISAYDKELVTKIIDPSLIVDEDLLEEVWAMAIVARSCLNPKPVKRPPMKYILRALENPLKVVREENYPGSSSRLRNNSSRRSWSAAIFGSWRHSLSESAPMPGYLNNGSRQSGRMGSQSSGGNDFSSSNKRSSNEIFPEPITVTDVERADGH